MKPKKNAKADLRKKPKLFLSFGLIIALTASLLLIEWRTYAREEFSEEEVYLDAFKEEVIRFTERANTPPPRPPIIP